MLAPRLAHVQMAATVGDVELARVLSRFDELLARRDGCAMVLELHDELVMPASVRKRLASELEARRDAIRTHCVALAIVARTPAAQGVHTALRWLAPPACFERVFHTYGPAEAWARSQLGASSKETP